MKVLSIDVGIKNLAIYVEEFDEKKIKSLKKEYKDIDTKFDKSHCPTKEYKSFLKQIFMNGETVFFDLVNLSSCQAISGKFPTSTEKTSSSKYVTTDILLCLNDYLDSKKKIWDECSFILVENQMNTRFKKNTSAQHIQHHIQSYFIFNYRDFKPFINYPSKNKGYVLGAPRKIKNKKTTYAQLKGWSEQLGLSILEKRCEETIMDQILKLNKRDDIMDSLVQLQSAKIKIFIEETIK